MLPRYARANSIPFRFWYLNKRRRNRANGGSSAPVGNMRISPANGSYRIKSGNYFQLWNDVNDNRFNTFFPLGPAIDIKASLGAGDLSASDADADAVSTSNTATFRFVNSLFELWNETIGSFHAPYIDGTPGAYYVVWTVADATANPAPGAVLKGPVGGNYRVTSDDRFQLAHFSSGLFHSIWASGPNAGLVLQIGAAES